MYFLLFIFIAETEMARGFSKLILFFAIVIIIDKQHEHSQAYNQNKH